MELALTRCTFLPFAREVNDQPSPSVAAQLLYSGWAGPSRAPSASLEG